MTRIESASDLKKIAKRAAKLIAAKLELAGLSPRVVTRVKGGHEWVHCYAGFDPTRRNFDALLAEGCDAVAKLAIKKKLCVFSRLESEKMSESWSLFARDLWAFASSGVNGRGVVVRAYYLHPLRYEFPNGLPSHEFIRLDILGAPKL